ncbi:MAG: M1 family metallopeptidase [bacterium]
MSYALHLHADPAKPTFRGELALTLDIAKPTKRIVLNSKGLAIKTARLEQKRATTPGRASNDAKAERVTITLAKPAAKGKAVLHLAYEGKVAQGMAGLYLSKDGSEVCLATQCEATDARAILPCFDEPEHKAVFAWTVTAPAKHRVLTNGAQVSRKVKGGLATTTFEPTGPMASYLAACVIGPFASTKTTQANGTPFAVWALGGKQNLGNHGRDLAAQMLPWYEDYFGQPYAFGKYDQVAVPSFAFGAMENAGLVTFRPSLLLVDPKAASWGDRRDVALVVAHEFAHMWFGDLVTMAWWDDLWLNEAFAEWMAHKVVDAQHPDLDAWNRFRARAAGALSTDTLQSTHAIYHPIKTPAEAAEMFDAITYGKGSAVMRMLEAFLGPDAFRKGLQSYMREFRFKNAAGADLWRHLGKAAGQDVGRIMKDWVGQPGHPALSCAWDGRLRVTQARAVSSPLVKTTAQRWRVPMVIRYEDGDGVHVVRHLLSRPSEIVDIPISGRLHWLWPNAEDVGFYQCNLDAGLRRSAVEHASRLRPEERIAFVRDFWFQVRAGQADANEFLAVFAQLADGEARYDVVQQTVGLMRGAERILETAGMDAALTPLRLWVAKSLGASYRKLGPEPGKEDTDMTRERRAALLRALAAVARDPSAIADARGVAIKERRKPAAVDATVSGVAVAIEAVVGDAATLKTHLATYKKRRDGHASPQDVERYLYVLPAFREPKLVEAVLATLKGGDVAPQAVGPILRAMLVEPHSQRQAWAYVQRNWTQIKTKLGEAWVANIVEASGELPADLAPKVLAFYRKRLGKMAGQAFKRAQERLEQNAEFMQRVAPGVEKWAKSLA